MHHRVSRLHIVPEKYEFLISEYWEVLLIEVDEPTTYDESLNSLESNKWFETMKSEIDPMYTNQL